MLHMSLFSCVQMYFNCHPLSEKNQGMLAKLDKMCGHEDSSILPSIYIFLFQSTLDDIVSNQLNAKHNNGTRFRKYKH